MRTVDKALRLLNLFTVDRPEAGLSELARQADLDKATTLRMLSSLARQGFVEQHPDTRKYRLGQAVLKLARIRETAFPVVSIIQPALDQLAKQTGETAHGSLASGATLLTVGVAEPHRTTRVHIDPSEPLPYHATASGLAYLAFSPDEIVVPLLDAGAFAAFTEHTPTSAEALRARLAETRERGYSVSEAGYESDVIGFAAPIFDWTGHACGAIAVAAMVARTGADARSSIPAAVVRAAIDVTHGMGAEPDPVLLASARTVAA